MLDFHQLAESVSQTSRGHANCSNYPKVKLTEIKSNNYPIMNNDKNNNINLIINNMSIFF